MPFQTRLRRPDRRANGRDAGHISSTARCTSASLKVAVCPPLVEFLVLRRFRAFRFPRDLRQAGWRLMPTVLTDVDSDPGCSRSSSSPKLKKIKQKRSRRNTTRVEHPGFSLVPLSALTNQIEHSKFLFSSRVRCDCPRSWQARYSYGLLRGVRCGLTCLAQRLCPQSARLKPLNWLELTGEVSQADGRSRRHTPPHVAWVGGVGGFEAGFEPIGSKEFRHIWALSWSLQQAGGQSAQKPAAEV